MHEDKRYICIAAPILMKSHAHRTGKYSRIFDFKVKKYLRKRRWKKIPLGNDDFPGVYSCFLFPSSSL